MLDTDLAEIYGYETKNFKRQLIITLQNSRVMILCLS